jgi:iron complex outermembrane receptor protein
MKTPIAQRPASKAVSTAVAVALGMTTLAPAGLAQSADGGLEEITVTATKREQSLQDVPISIAVVTGETLADRSIKNFEDFSTLVPNFNVVRSPGANAIFMRGIGSGPGSPSLDQSVVMFIDGVYGGRARQFAGPLLDIERIEVLRGPQGALVGKNTSAGAINISSARPGKEFEGSVTAEYDFDLEGTTLTGVLSSPMSDRLGVRVAAKYMDLDGYIDNTVSGKKDPGRREEAARLTAVYTGDNVTVTGKIETSDVKLRGSNIQAVSVRANRAFDYVREFGSSLGRDFDTNDADTAVLTVDWNVGEHTVTSITSYSQYETRQGIDADFIESDLAYSRFDENFDQRSQEFRLLSPTGGRIEYVLGVYAHENDLLETRTTATTFAPAGNTIRFFDQGSKTLSLYAQGTFTLGDSLSAVVGLRHTDESKDATYLRIGGPNATTQGIGTTQASFANSIDESEFDPSFSLQYRADDDQMLYASYSQGSKSGGFQGAIANATPAAFTFTPESSESVEFGYKRSFPGRGYIDIVAFDTKYEDLQVSVSIQGNPAVSGGFAFFTGNAASAKARGVEATGAFVVNDWLRLEGALAFMNTEFDDYVDGPCATGQTPNNPARNSCVLTGAELPFSPKWSGNLTAKVNRALTAAWTFEGSLTSYFRDDARVEFVNDPQMIQKSFVKWDARLALVSESGLELALLGRNLTDEATFSFASAAPLAASPRGIAPDARGKATDVPRTVAIQARYKF